MTLAQYRRVFFLLAGLLVLTVLIDATFGWLDLYRDDDTRLPIGLFTFLKLVISAYVLVNLYSARYEKTLTLAPAEEVALVVILLLFQPIFDIALPKAVWLLVDMIAVAIMSYLERDFWGSSFRDQKDRFWSFIEKSDLISRARILGTRLFPYFLVLLFIFGAVFFVFAQVTLAVSEDAGKYSRIEVSRYCQKVLKAKMFLTEDEKQILEWTDYWAGLDTDGFKLSPQENRDRFPYKGSYPSIKNSDTTNDRVMAFEYSAPLRLYPNLCSYISEKWAMTSNSEFRYSRRKGDLISHGFFFANEYKKPEYFYQIMRDSYGLPNIFGFVEYIFWKDLQSSDKTFYPISNLNLYSLHE